MSQPDDPDERLRDGDKTAIPIPGVSDLSYNEIHSVKLGCVGLVAGLAYALGHVNLALTLSVTLIGYAILGHPIGRSAPDDATPSIGARTIRHEPWYFTIAYLSTALAGAMFAGVFA